MFPVSKQAPDSRSIAAVLGAVGGALGRPSAQSVGVSDIFAEEIERAVERQGGEGALEARRGAVTDTRRAGRHGEFDRYRDETDAAKRAERGSDDDGADAELAPAALRVNEQVPTGADADEARGTGRERFGAVDAKEEPAAQKARPESGSAQVEASKEQGVPASAGAINGDGAVRGNGAPSGAGKIAISAMRAVAPSSSGASSDGNAAFLSGARGGADDTRGDAATKSSAPAPSTPDEKLVEHAAEVLKQIRIGLKGGAAGGAKEVTVQLSPVELGRLSIKMRLADGKLSTVVRAESAQTLELLEKQAPELRAILAQQGFETESLELELGFGAEYGAPRRDDASAARGSTPTPASLAPSRDEPITEPVHYPTRASDSEGRIDTFA